VDVRILSATHQNLKAMVEAARFRQDLFYRLNVIELRMPALRERSEDIPQLAEVLLARLAESSGLPAVKLSEAPSRRSRPTPFRATCGSSRTCWSGRWRCAAATPSGRRPAPRPERHRRGQPRRARDAGRGAAAGLPRPGRAPRDRGGPRKTGGNRTAAARALGVTFRSLRYRLERLGIKE
jgi:two-component system response regulator PilR (NtrC family)